MYCSLWVTVEAGTLIVTTTADSGAGSLRQVLIDANDGDTIQFDPSLVGQAINLTGGELGVTQNLRISGPGATGLTVSRDPKAAFLFRIFHVLPGHTAQIEGLTISGGQGDGGAGGIYNESSMLTINDCIVKNNVALRGDGGGIYNEGSLTIVDSIVSDNLATVDFAFNGGSAGGIYNVGTLIITNTTIRNNATASGVKMIGEGGGIVNGGSLTITDSTISGNSANFLGGGIVGVGPLTITNSTISGNFVNERGGGIANGGSLAISNCTVSDNQAQSGIGGGVYITGSNATLEIGNTILKAGTGTNISNDAGTVTSHGYNLSNDNGGGFLIAAGDQINIDPLLGPLQDNGGPTATHELLTGSPAINAGNPNFTPPPFTDQRGYERIYNGRIDVGSFEVQPLPTPSPTATATSSATATPTATPTGTPTATPTPSSTPGQPLNISTRLRVELGDRVMIGGFIITGSAPKNVVVRGIGPSLAGSGISDPLADPVLELRDGSGALVFQNDNWQDDSTQAKQLMALGLAPQDPKESGIVATLPSGAAYTAILDGTNNGTGVGLVEVYDINQSASSQLANISTRGFVQTGDNVMIGGFILGGGTANTSVAVRGIGPSLSPGLTGVLADPTLELRDGNGALLVSNDNWQDDSVSGKQLIAHGLAPQNSLESGIWASLSPGAFTAILAGNNSGTGIGLVEIYNVP